MVDELQANRNKLQRALLEFFFELTQLPVGLYEMNGAKPLELIQPQASADGYERHCTYLHTIPGAKARCDQDQCARTLSAFADSSKDLSPCHAGLWNAAVPITVGGKPRAAVLFGEMLLKDDEAAERESLARHEALVASLALAPEQARELKDRLFASKRYSRQQVEQFRWRVKQFEKWLYALFEQEDRIKHGLENVSHEVFIRLQSVVAQAENLTTEAAELSAPQTTERAEKILSAALALNTVVETLGSFLEEYRFRCEELSPLLEQAKATYEPEAERKGIKIELDIPSGGVMADVSKTHLQMALNNLLQNAIKYSFKTVPTARTRSVNIRCRTEPNQDVSITFTNYGVGILPEELARIFELGFKGRLTQGEYRHGSGRGLYMANEVVQKHGGRISVESRQMSNEVGPEGQPHLNKFRVTLPLRRKRS